jgi:hypothetical protein
MEAIETLDVQDRLIKISIAITAARLKARTGKTAEAEQDLDSVLAEASSLMLIGWEFESRLARTEIQATNARSQNVSLLRALEEDARNSGYLLVAKKTEHQLMLVLR